MPVDRTLKEKAVEATKSALNEWTAPGTNGPFRPLTRNEAAHLAVAAVFPVLAEAIEDLALPEDTGEVPEWNRALNAAAALLAPEGDK